MTQSESGPPASHTATGTGTVLGGRRDFRINVESASSEAIRGLIKQSMDARSSTDDLTAPNCECLVARLDGKPVGCIALVDHLRYGEARRLYVSEDMRGHGIALALVEALEAAARDIGLRQVRIDHPSASQDVLRPFMASGYKPTANAWMEKAL